MKINRFFLVFILLFSIFSVSHAEPVPFEEIDIETWICPLGSPFSQMIIPDENLYYDLIYSAYHDYYLQTLVSWERLSPEEIPYNYYDQLTELRQKSPGLKEVEYVRQVSGKLADLLENLSVAPMNYLQECRYPTFDASKETMVLVNFSTSGCGKADVQKGVDFDSVNQTYTVKTDVTQFGTCEMSYQTRVWLKIPGASQNPNIAFQRSFKVEER